MSSPDAPLPRFMRSLPDGLSVATDGTYPQGTDAAQRPPIRVVVKMPDYVADSLAHLLAYLSNITSNFGGLDGNGLHAASLAAALYGAAVSGEYRCPEGVLHLDRVSVDPAVMVGVPCIAGTRIPVVTVAGMHQVGRSVAEILADYPELREPDVQACLDWPAEIDDEDEPREGT
jgi:uncharacterized protein (DUF433 family)